MKKANSVPQPYSIILCDLGNFLVRVDYAAFLGSLNLNHSMTDEELYHLLEKDSLSYEAGRVSAEEFLTFINRKLHTSFTPHQFRRAWNSILPSPVPGVPKLIEQLATSYRLMVLSNTNALHFQHMLELLPVLGRFERYFLSFEIGASKPDPAIYKHVMENIDVPPQEVLFIDDLEQNIKGAKDARMNGIVFQGVESLRDELKQLKVI